MSFCFFPTFYICIKCQRKEASLGKATSRKQHKKFLVLQSSGKLPNLALPGLQLMGLEHPFSSPKLLGLFPAGLSTLLHLGKW